MKLFSSPLKNFRSGICVKHKSTKIILIGVENKKGCFFFTKKFLFFLRKFSICLKKMCVFFSKTDREDWFAKIFLKRFLIRYKPYVKIFKKCRFWLILAQNRGGFFENLRPNEHVIFQKNRKKRLFLKTPFFTPKKRQKNRIFQKNFEQI